MGDSMVTKICPTEVIIIAISGGKTKLHQTSVGQKRLQRPKKVTFGLHNPKKVTEGGYSEKNVNIIKKMKM